MEIHMNPTFDDIFNHSCIPVDYKYHELQEGFDHRVFWFDFIEDENVSSHVSIDVCELNGKFRIHITNNYEGINIWKSPSRDSFDQSREDLIDYLNKISDRINYIKDTLNGCYHDVEVSKVKEPRK
jgi:hypothetical protein